MSFLFSLLLSKCDEDVFFLFLFFFYDCYGPQTIPETAVEKFRSDFESRTHTSSILVVFSRLILHPSVVSYSLFPSPLTYNPPPPTRCYSFRDVVLEKKIKDRWKEIDKSLQHFFSTQKKQLDMWSRPWKECQCLAAIAAGMKGCTGEYGSGGHCGRVSHNLACWLAESVEGVLTLECSITAVVTCLNVAILCKGFSSHTELLPFWRGKVEVGEEEKRGSSHGVINFYFLRILVFLPAGLLSARSNTHPAWLAMLCNCLPG